MKSLLRKVLGRGAAVPQGEHAEEAAAGDSGSWLLQIAGTTVLSAAIVLFVLRVLGSASPPIVTFDLLKYENAERAVAMQFLSKQDPGDAGALLQSISKRTRSVIEDIAGPGTVVVISQAVVQGQTRDITDEVLKRLDLPTNVPTATPSKYALDVAPTMIGHGPAFPQGASSVSPPSPSTLP